MGEFGSVVDGFAKLDIFRADLDWHIKRAGDIVRKFPAGVADSEHINRELDIEAVVKFRPAKRIFGAFFVIEDNGDLSPVNLRDIQPVDSTIEGKSSAIGKR